MLPTNQQLRWVNMTRYVLPIILFSIVFLYETWEHLLLAGAFRWDPHLTAEVLFFGILGPAAVFIVLSKLVSLLDAQITTSRQLEALNHSLEKLVLERTRELEVRNRELAQANVELQELDRLKSEFVSLVSHELRGPLTTLNGGLEMALQNGADLPPESRHILEVIARESSHLTQFVQTILDVSRMEARKLTFNMGPTALCPLLRRAVETVYAASKRGVSWSIPEYLPPVWADEIYLEEIFCNLLSNADKYSPVNKPVVISAQVNNSSVEIQIIDYGPGIPMDKQSQIFKRFVRFEHGDRIQNRGWGLGLYFARALAEGQGSELTVESPVHPFNETPGSAFKLKLAVAGEVPEDD
ncbi:MAG: HAMP domain-containing sensor histidine kinase [Anaerolineales bacterium]|nr:HAMP domain-containing sensor histidine kinase [Anaerolineales bacterium]